MHSKQEYSNNFYLVNGQNSFLTSLCDEEEKAYFLNMVIYDMKGILHKSQFILNDVSDYSKVFSCQHTYLYASKEKNRRKKLCAQEKEQVFAVFQKGVSNAE